MLVCSKLWECPHCSRKYSSQDYLRVHIKSDCKNNPQVNVFSGKHSTVSGIGSKRSCKQEQVYDGTVKLSSVSKVKLRVNSGNGSDECEMKHDRIEHDIPVDGFENDHRRGKHPYQCDHCGKTFTRQGHLKKHARIHSGEKPYKCEYCGKTFTENGNLKSHERTHTGDRPYECEHCGKTFTVTSSLKRHEKTHTGERPYQCEHCGKTFAENGHLKKHERTHTGEKPYECDHCGKSFTQRSNLKTHEKTHT